jgi:hypothetical protein
MFYWLEVKPGRKTAGGRADARKLSGLLQQNSPRCALRASVVNDPISACLTTDH